jgi:hydrogenase maturation protein HypF
MAAPAETARQRRSLRIRGRVQGVGFRPAILRFADRLSLGGFVRNDNQGVLIEIEGGAAAVARFVAELPTATPAIARIESFETRELPPLGEERFRIVPSTEVTPTGANGEMAAAIPADLAPCADCLRELMDPADRRYRYPFINCTACGPRFTIVRALPYDRPQTTMSRFKMCGACRREYDDPADRRFHAEPNACPACGPRLQLVASGTPRSTGEAALVAAAAALRAGQILALKGVGGFLLACDANRGDAVSRLRARKRRPDKPLAVMARSLVELERLVELDEVARAALLSPARPIVIARARDRGQVAPGIAAGLPELGVFLPATPLQHLLLADGPALQVMTSGNLADEALVRDDREALTRLGGIADLFLLHGRKIHAHADDSVIRVIAGGATTLRRARGFVPESFPLPFVTGAPPILAVGAELKTTVCLTRGDEAILSQHLGELHDAETYRRFEETIAKLIVLSGAVPVAVAHDLHPDLRSTRWAQRAGVRLYPVQHHHAHVAACLVEHGRTAPVLAVAFDGTGLGPDGTLWGGEILLADLGGYRRLGHLRPIRLPGGEAAIRAPWRLAASALFDAGEPTNLVAHAGVGALAAVHEAWRRGLGGVSTGAGRWFDAVSALCGVRREISYDGQAAIELEALAAPGEHAGYDFWIEQRPEAPFVIDLRPTIRDIAYGLRIGTPAREVSARFHRTLAQAIATACRHARDAGAPNTVVLTGGCFQNRLLTELTVAELAPSGFEVLLHRRVPANDGGLALGQAAVAAYQRAKAVAACA